MRRLILVLATMGVAVLLASGAALGITGGWADDGVCQAGEPTPCGGGIIKYRGVGALVDKDGVYCSGTLVEGKDLENGNPGPPVFLTAAHCYPWVEGDPSYVTFDPRYSLTKEQSKAFPVGGGVEYKGTFHDDPTLDIAVVIFDNTSTPPNTIPTANLPAIGQLAGTQKGAKFTPVGYGDTSGSSFDAGARRYAVSTFKSLNRTYLSTSQHRGSGGTCYGDSGGPNFFGAPGASNVIAGITITGDTWCKATNVTLRLDTERVHAFLDDYVKLQ